MDEAREAILGRVRQALKTPSPSPHWEREPLAEGSVFPLPAADDESALRQRFRDEFTLIQGEMHEVDSLEQAKAFLADWLHKQEITSALAPAGPLSSVLDQVPFVRWLDGPSPDKSGWENIDVGFTPAESLVAESGTIAVSSRSGGRAMSVLPPIHFVIASADQLVPDLETSMQRLRAKYETLPSNISWISGPSRTADIEKILVLGAHGPRRLVLLLLPAGSIPGQG